jgi:hypothetical protein
MSPPPESSGSSADKPADPERAWRENFDAYERMIGKPLEEFVQSDAFADAAAEYIKRHGDVKEQVKKSSQAWLDMWNMASASDVRALRREIDALAKRLDAVEARLEGDTG